ncbi:iron-sulfur cluster assembly protein [Tumebacillus sp. BK434]|uniref:iron-sulfur cluster insertion protein ErpA n=1 Tax=Tumebacillus sp. BK434 TaxID=2512169 RepID=UPI00104F5AAF|nr:iron-sulfur cluster insertion protein ErpA [Tumebacillus sp. BK434]TCP52902.1 iron-sulfur cluster assembly protein [Tumebacillus sp. BK434]
MVTLTESAAEKVSALLAQKDNPNLALRIFIKSGGCSGFSYGMALDEKKDNDAQYELNGVKVVVDEMSGQYLDGAVVDYVDSLMGAGFKIENPNAASTCGCGSSFRTAGDAGKPGACS